MVTVQAPVPEQSPLQPVKVEPADGVGVSVTIVFLVKDFVHVAPQSIPAGELVTVPVPLPFLFTARISPDVAPVMQVPVGRLLKRTLSTKTAES
jgi:hypothetical protein